MRSVLVATSLLALTACATVSKLTIEDRLRDLGFTHKQAGCVSSKLDDRLNNRQLADVAKTLDQITGETGPRRALDALGRVSDEEIARAAAQAGVACIFAR